MTNLEAVCRAIVHLQRARDLLKRASATKSTARVRLALSSAQGAARHAINKSARARFDRRS